MRNLLNLYFKPSTRLWQDRWLRVVHGSERHVGGGLSGGSYVDGGGVMMVSLPLISLLCAWNEQLQQLGLCFYIGNDGDGDGDGKVGLNLSLGLSSFLSNECECGHVGLGEEFFRDYVRECKGWPLVSTVWLF